MIFIPSDVIGYAVNIVVGFELGPTWKNFIILSLNTSVTLRIVEGLSPKDTDFIF